MSADAAWIGYVRAAATADGPSSVVTAKRDGSGERTMPVFGMASVAFSPTAPLVASIGPTAATAGSFDIPVGPLRILDATTGKTRTLLDGTVVQRLVEPGRQDDRRDRGPAGRLWRPVRAGCLGGHGLGDAVALGRAAPGGRIRRNPPRARRPPRRRFPRRSGWSSSTRRPARSQSDAVIEPGRLFVDQYLTYFDQYATSHQLWAPDSSSILIPVDDATAPTCRLVPRAGGTAKLLDGVMGAWSP